MAPSPEYVEDDTLILSTPYIPDFQEAIAMRLRMACRAAEIGTIDEEISSGKTSPRIWARRRTLLQPNLVAEALLAPMRRLPTELLGEIFTRTIPALSVEQALKPNPQPFDEGEPYPHHMRLVLRQVCRLWNIVVEDTPRLWSILAIDDQHHLPDFQRGVVYSKTCPLDIYIGRFGWHVSVIPKLLHPEVGRIRQLILSRPPYGGLMRLVPGDDCFALAHMLEILAWSWEDMDSFSPLETGLVRFDAPKLQFVALVDTPHTLTTFPATSLRGLRRLHFLSPRNESYSSRNYLGLLSCCPSLEELKLQHISGLGDSLGQEDVIVPLLFLKTLVVAHSHDDDTIIFLENLRVPHLEDLSLSLNTFPRFGDEGHWPIDPGLRAVLAEARTSIRKIKLQQLCLIGDEDAPLLSSLVNLHTLEIKKCIIGNAVLVELTPESTSVSTTWPCPQLSSLMFNGVKLSGEELVRLVRYRTCPDNAQESPTKFTSIRIKNSHGMEDHHEEECFRLACDRSCTFQIRKLRMPPEPLDSFDDLDASSDTTYE